jgi:predicted RNA-binding protein YlqC (UPF0109 family)
VNAAPAAPDEEGTRRMTPDEFREVVDVYLEQHPSDRALIARLTAEQEGLGRVISQQATTIHGLQQQIAQRQRGSPPLRSDREALQIQIAEAEARLASLRAVMTPEELDMLPDALRAAGREILDRLTGPFKAECTKAVDAEIARLNAAADAAVTRLERTIELLDRVLRKQGAP